MSSNCSVNVGVPTTTIHITNNSRPCDIKDKVNNKVGINEVLDKITGGFNELREICKCKTTDSNQEVKELLSKLALVVDLESGGIVNVTNKSLTGKTYEDCVRSFAQHHDKIYVNSENKLEGDCGDDVLCRDCIDAINSSIVLERKIPVPLDEGEVLFSLNEMLAPVNMVSVI